MDRFRQSRTFKSVARHSHSAASSSKPTKIAQVGSRRSRFRRPATASRSAPRRS